MLELPIVLLASASVPTAVLGPNWAIPPPPAVAVSRSVASERLKTDSRVAAGVVVLKRLGTVGRAIVAADIADQRFIADRVLVANGVVKECVETNGRIPDSAGEVMERVGALSVVWFP